ncbi:2,3-butanediol dehydrogenase [Gordonia neofelifaecis]|uniref:Zn-containing alcohol dehydrogenase n=1 Tax=Gordonia neofelifaecis NRRL B-59395 TaxID=644548 RepID=F1YJV4_9ACTN|nr:2,3-butanediol dehydrogenase [Gordonia neofelifaecis]EGD55036.1 Zn-containing alcohol dehydrogenase [Gordonia neofelifaecis NRRL B-59395]
MKSLLLFGAQDARVVDVPEPEPGPGQVKVKVECAGICGSDLSLFQYAPIPAGFKHPLLCTDGPHALGHEFSGRVVALGEGVDDIEVGALVAIRPNVYDGTCPACLRGEQNLCKQGGFIGVSGGGGGFSEYAVAGRDAAHVIPEEFGPEVAAMVESTAVAWHAVKQSGATAGTSALVIGAGPVGLGLVACLKARGADTVYVSELSAARKERAAAMGAEVLDPSEVDVVAHVQEVGGVDVSFDASGVGQPTYDTALDALRPGGTSVVVAMFHEPVQVDLQKYMTSEKRLVGSMAYTDADFGEVVDAIVDGRLDPKPLITGHIKLDDIVDKGLNHLLGEGRNSEIKILVS